LLGHEDVVLAGHDHLVTTVLDAFERFRVNLELTGLQESTVADRQWTVRAVRRAASGAAGQSVIGAAIRYSCPHSRQNASGNSRRSGSPGSTT